MFDFAWSEFALIGVVALVLIGPKDLPIAIKAVAQTIKKARRMAGEFQTHVDEMVREANLQEVRDQFNDLRRMDIKGQILKAVDGDGTIRKHAARQPDGFLAAAAGGAGARQHPAVAAAGGAGAVADHTPAPDARRPSCRRPSRIVAAAAAAAPVAAAPRRAAARLRAAVGRDGAN